MTSDREDLLIKVGFLFVVLIVTGVINFSVADVTNYINAFSGSVTAGTSQIPLGYVLIGIIGIVLLFQEATKK